VSPRPGDVTSMWLFLDRRSEKFEITAWGSLGLFGGLTELNDHCDSPEVVWIMSPVNSISDPTMVTRRGFVKVGTCLRAHVEA
jgi:hypothetical protein